MARRRFLARFSNPLGIRPKRLFRLRRWTWRRFLKTSFLIASSGFVAIIFLFAWYARDLPTPGKIRKYHPVEATQIFDRAGQPLYAVFGEEKRLSITADQIPAIVKFATISVEDKDFYKHRGIDLRGIIRGTILRPLTGQRAQGGSTITQQYVKNALLSPERSIDRKIKELILSLELEVILSKDEILTLYLNEIPYGSNAYGIETAAQTFFNKPAQDLTLAEAAMLAALPQRPSYFSPYGSHVDELTARQDYILERMATLGYITEDEAVAAASVEVAFVPRREHITAPHFVMYVRDQLVEKYGEQLVLEGGLKVTTTLDSEAQRAAEEAVRKAADQYLERYNADNAALAAIDPRNGQILAMVGSLDYFNQERQGNFNVTTGQRQPGSSIKPLIYATAFKDKWTPASTVWDVLTDFGNYIPHNYDNAEHGPMSIRSALANSYNIPAVKILALVGIKDAIATARDFGITTLTDPDRYGLSLVLGGAEVKPLELAAAYGVFAAGGDYHPTSAILKVEDSKGRVLEEWHDETRSVLAPEIAYQITSILADNAARTPTFGSRSALYFPNREVAAKTGTTQEYRDGWTVGYTPSVTTAVWVGNNDNSPMDKAGGVRAAGPIFHDFITSYYGASDSGQFSRPETLKDVTVDALSGKIPAAGSPQTIQDLFAPWQIPTEKDDVHLTVQVNKLNGKLATDLTPPELIEERTYLRVHSEKPTDHRWEEPVLRWAKEHGFELSEPPTEKDPTTIDDLPKISLLAPLANAVLTGTFSITTQPSSTIGIRSVEIYLDGVLIGTLRAAPWTLTYDAANLTSGNHEILAEITDNYGARARTSVLVIIARDQTPPGPVTNLSAQSVGLLSGGVKLSWKNPSENDLFKVRIYRSTTSGQLGSLIGEVEVTAGTQASATLSGQAIGTTYYFTVRPVDEAGNENQTQTQVSFTTI